MPLFPRLSAIIPIFTPLYVTFLFYLTAFVVFSFSFVFRSFNMICVGLDTLFASFFAFIFLGEFLSLSKLFSCLAFVWSSAGLERADFPSVSGWFKQQAEMEITTKLWSLALVENPILFSSVEYDVYWGLSGWAQTLGSPHCWGSPERKNLVVLWTQAAEGRRGRWARSGK